MASTVIKNWDNKTWLSSKGYIKSFNRFLIKKVKLNPKSTILDIGCGRGKILGSLSSILSLRDKPIGIDIINHKDKEKRIIYKKKNAISFLFKNKKKFDLILIKQTIHLLNLKEIKNDRVEILRKHLLLGSKVLCIILFLHMCANYIRNNL